MLLNATEAITSRLAAKPDWTVRALAADLRASGIAVSHDTVWRFLRRQGLSFKKNAAGQRDRAACPGASADTLAGAPAPV
jgi:transposase